MESGETAAFDREIGQRLTAAGLAVPPDLAAGVVSEARDLIRATALLRSPRTAAAEPSNTFSLVRYLGETA